MPTISESEVRQLVRQNIERLIGRAPRPAPPAPAGSPMSRLSSHKPRTVYQDDVRAIADGGSFELPSGARLTPLAQELVLQKKIKIISASAAHPKPQQQATVALSADHGGYAIKELLKAFLGELGFGQLDLGTNSGESVDYPDFAYAVAQAVADGRATRGIMIDGAGIGSCMVANKVPGVRASMCYDVSTASNAREHNDANVLTLGGQLIGTNLAKQIVKTWLTTDFGGGRHAKRVNKIVEVEQRFLRQ